MHKMCRRSIVYCPSDVYCDNASSKMMLFLPPNVGGVAGNEAPLSLRAVRLARPRHSSTTGPTSRHWQRPSTALKFRMCCNVDYVHWYVTLDWACDGDGDNSTDTSALCDDPVLLTTYRIKAVISLQLPQVQ